MAHAFFGKSVDDGIGAKNLRTKTSLHQILLDHFILAAKNDVVGMVSCITYQPNLLLFLYFLALSSLLFPAVFNTCLCTPFSWHYQYPILRTGYYKGNAYMPGHKLAGTVQVLLHVHVLASATVSATACKHCNSFS